MAIKQFESKYIVEWVPLDLMRVRWGISQRHPDPARINKIAKDFEPDAMGMPHVNHVDGLYWIVDGQTRVEALKLWLVDWSGQKIKGFVYRELSERDEADLFLTLNNVKAVSTFDKYIISLTAEREDETNADAIVRKHKLKVARTRADGVISCVGMLMRVYGRGQDILDRTLEIAYAGFGNDGLESDLIDGLSRVIARYDGLIKSSQAIHALRAVAGGPNAIRTRAARLKQEYAVDRGQCIAAAIVEAINRKREGKKLVSWWKAEE